MSCVSRNPNPFTIFDIRDACIRHLTVSSKYDLIGPSAFKGCKDLISVALPETLTRIEHRAFEQCSNLRQMFIPENVRFIGKRAFSSCLMCYSFKLPFHLKKIGSHAFFKCQNVKQVTLPPNISKIGESVFESCHKLERLIFPDLLLHIPSRTCFECLKLSHVGFPNRIEEIGEFAFLGCAFNVLNFPEKLIRIRKGGFMYNIQLQSLYLPPTLKIIEDHAFDQCNSIQHVFLFGDVVKIGKNAFSTFIPQIHFKWDIFENTYSSYLDQMVLNHAKNEARLHIFSFTVQSLSLESKILDRIGCFLKLKK